MFESSSTNCTSSLPRNALRSFSGLDTSTLTLPTKATALLHMLPSLGSTSADSGMAYQGLQGPCVPVITKSKLSILIPTASQPMLLTGVAFPHLASQIHHSFTIPITTDPKIFAANCGGIVHNITTARACTIGPKFQSHSRAIALSIAATPFSSGLNYAGSKSNTVTTFKTIKSKPTALVEETHRLADVRTHTTSAAFVSSVANIHERATAKNAERKQLTGVCRDVTVVQVVAGKKGNRSPKDRKRKQQEDNTFIQKPNPLINGQSQEQQCARKHTPQCMFHLLLPQISPMGCPPLPQEDQLRNQQ